MKYTHNAVKIKAKKSANSKLKELLFGDRKLSNFIVRHLAFCVASSALLVPTVLRAQDPSQQFLTLNFRPGHSVTLLAAVNQNKWNIESAGNLEGQSGDSVAAGYALRYAFHFNLVGNWGLLIGTAAQANFEYKNYGGFVPGPSIIFPSITGGIVRSLSFENRIALCAEYSAIWYPWLKTVGESSRPVEIGVIPDTGAFFVQYDYFYSRTRSLTFISGWRHIENTCLGSCEGDTLLGKMRIQNSGVFFQVGVTWQPGDELGQY